MFTARLGKQRRKYNTEQKLNSFSPDAITNLIFDSDSEEDDDGLRDEIVILSSLCKPKLKKVSTGDFTIRPKVRYSTSNATYKKV